MTSEPGFPDGARTRPRVSPNAKSTAPRGPHEDAAVKLSVALPADGRAIAEVERSLTEENGAAPSRVRRVGGLSGRDRTEFFEGVGAGRVRPALASRPR